MKKLAIIDGKQDIYFSSYLLNLLHELQISLDSYTENELINEQHFDYVIINSEPEREDLFLNAGYCFINMDEVFHKKANVYGSVITYGFGSKNTVTLSSIERENHSLVYCLQRYVNYNGLKVLEPGEMPIHLHCSEYGEFYALMVAITIGFLEGVKEESLKGLLKESGIINYAYL